MVRPIAALAGALCALCLWQAAMAQEIADKAKEAESLAGDGRFIAAIEALDAAEAALWAKAPLTFRKALWVAEQPAGFGVYDPRESNVYKSGAEMIAYAEPIGFGWRKSGDLWRMKLVADVKSMDGAELFRQANFQPLEIGSRVQNREFFGHFTYTLTDIPAGEYVIDTILHDTVTGKSGTMSLPFVIK